MANFPSFSDQAVQSAIESASQYYRNQAANVINTTIGVDDGHVATLAECISVTIGSGKVCLNLPLGIGSVCIPIPVSFDGQVAQACLSICTTWGIPSGVEVTVSVAGVVIVRKSFGKC